MRISRSVNVEGTEEQAACQGVGAGSGAASDAAARPCDGTARWVCRGMVAGCNARRGLMATALALVAVILGPAARGQEFSAAPSPADAMGAYQVLDKWIREWNVPEVSEVATVPAAAAVTLRLDGKVMGRGVSAEADGGSLRRAAAAAWTEASARLPGERDALREAALRETARDITISLELAGSFVPLTGDDLETAAAGVNPGIHGVAVRAGERVAVMFPGRMLAGDTTTAEAVGSLLTDLYGAEKRRLLLADLRLRPLNELRESEGIRLYRFGVTHVAQVSPKGQATFLHRGGRVVQMKDMNADALRQFADGVAAHLVSLRYDGPEALGMLGTVQAVLGRHSPAFAEPAEQAVAALALRRYVATPGVDAGGTARATRLADDLLAGLARVEHGERDPAGDAASAAACVVAYLEGERPPPATEIRMAGLLASCRKTVQSAFDAETGFAPGVPAGAKGLVAWAVVRLALESGDAAARERASLCVKRVLLDTHASDVVTHLPWLGWAAMELAGSGEIGAAVALREARDVAWAHQFSAADAGPEDQDLAGGIVFTRGRAGLPSWNTARPAAFFASVLADDRLTGEAERSRELVRLLGAVRFLRQLAVDEAVAHMIPDGRWRWGVRAAAWDYRLPPDASSLTLLTVCETIRSLDLMRK